jgi:hypothetical protein
MQLFSALWLSSELFGPTTAELPVRVQLSSAL